MNRTQILGKRIKYFRNRAGLSQLELENLINAAYGSISRIENGTVNPSKETIEKIIKALNIKGREIDYLNGKLFYPASENEVRLAIQEIRSYFDKDSTLAYLLDDRYRLLYISKGFYNFFGYKEEDLKPLIGWTIFELMLDEDSPLPPVFLEERKDEILEGIVARFYNEASFMQDDEIVARSIKHILANLVTSSVWRKILKDESLVYKFSDRKVHFLVNGEDITLVNSVEPVFKYPRFEIVDYTSA